MKNGFEVTEIHTFIEYEPAECFKDFQKTLYELRVQATIDNNTAQASAAKLTGNAPFGKVSGNLKFQVIIIFSEHPESRQIQEKCYLWPTEDEGEVETRDI